MHDAPQHFLAQHATHHADLVLELGSRNVNGTPRQHFPGATYVGVDQLPALDADGGDVQIVADARSWVDPEARDFDVVVCSNVMEHVADWERLIDTARDNLAVGGQLLVTTVRAPFPEHNGTDGTALAPGEHYAGVEAHALVAAIETRGFRVQHLHTSREGDVMVDAVFGDGR